jgi:hypothetical protein
MFTNDIVGASKSDEGVIDENSIRLYAPGIPSTATLAQVQKILSLGGDNDSPARELARFTKDVAENNATDMSGARFSTQSKPSAHSPSAALQSASSTARIASYAAATTSRSSIRASLPRASRSRTRTLRTSTRMCACRAACSSAT